MAGPLLGANLSPDELKKLAEIQIAQECGLKQDLNG
jgi:hypothetical protein